MEQVKLENIWKLSPGKRGEILLEDKIDLLYIHDNENVIYSICEIAARVGFTKAEESIIATAASELSTNILRFAKSGSIYVAVIKEEKDGCQRIGMEILAADNGPGIEDINKAMQEHYSTIVTSLGLGLPSVKRMMDEFYMESIAGKGTRVLVYKWRKD